MREIHINLLYITTMNKCASVFGAAFPSARLLFDCRRSFAVYTTWFDQGEVCERENSSISRLLSLCLCLSSVCLSICLADCLPVSVCLSCIFLPVSVSLLSYIHTQAFFLFSLSLSLIANLSKWGRLTDERHDIQHRCSSSPSGRAGVPESPWQTRTRRG